MSVRKLTTSLLTLLLVWGGAVRTVGWEPQPVFVDPHEFDPDFQWFEPIYDLDLADMKPKKRAHTGWFATYDRLNLYTSRPDATRPQEIESKLDSGWGHRYQVGYMLPDEDTGWLFNWTENGVSSGDRVGPELLVEFLVLNRAYPIEGTLNETGTNLVNNLEYDSYELNKTWRLEPYHYGGILEPMIGLRWMRIDDRARFENFDTTVFDGVLPIEGILTSQYARTDNEMFGGQLGFRYTKFRDRFTFATEFRVFAGGSWQSTQSSQRAYDVRVETFSNATTDFDQVIRQLIDVDPVVRSRNEEGFVGFEVRTELAYQLTKQFSIRAGVQLIDVATGVWRGGDGSQGSLPAGDQNQDVLMVGGTFGINLNH